MIAESHVKPGKRNRFSLSEARGIFLLHLAVIRYPLLDSALESMRRHASAKAGSGGGRNAQTEAPGRPVLGQWASEIGVVSEVPSDDNSLTISGVSC